MWNTYLWKGQLNKCKDSKKKKLLFYVFFFLLKILFYCKIYVWKKRLFYIIKTTYHSFLVVNHLACLSSCGYQYCSLLPITYTTLSARTSTYAYTEQKILFSISLCPVSSYLCSFLLSRLDFVITTSKFFFFCR